MPIKLMTCNSDDSKGNDNGSDAGGIDDNSELETRQWENLVFKKIYNASKKIKLLNRWLVYSIETLITSQVLKSLYRLSFYHLHEK